MRGLTLESAFLAAISLVIIVLLSLGFARRPANAVPLLLLVEMGNASSITPGVMVGQLHVFPEDVLAVALALATLLRLQQRGHGLHPDRRLVVLLAVLLLGMARGAEAFGLQTSVVYAREMLDMVIAGVFFSMVRVTPQLVRFVRNWFLLASGVLTFVAVIFWFQHGFGTYAATGDRALDELQALIVQTTIITVLFPPFRNLSFSWRLQGWSILINRQISGPHTDLIVGSPSGTGYERVINGSTATVAPHSEYISVLDETGIIGVALLVWVYMRALRKSRRRLRSSSAFVSQVALLFTALLALQLTYFIGYSEGALVGLMLGLAWIHSRKRPRPVGCLASRSCSGYAVNSQQYDDVGIAGDDLSVRIRPGWLCAPLDVDRLPTKWADGLLDLAAYRASRQIDRCGDDQRSLGGFDDRSGPGIREGHLIVGSKSRSAMGHPLSAAAATRPCVAPVPTATVRRR